MLAQWESKSLPLSFAWLPCQQHETLQSKCPFDQHAPAQNQRYAWPLRLKASCSAAVRVARNVVRDIGVESAAKSPGLLKVARCSESNAERDTHRVLVKQCKLGLPIPLRRLGRGELDYTVLRLRDWFQWLVNSNCIHTLTGLTAPDHTRERCILKEFWSRYRSSNGDHPVFRLAAQGRLKLESTVPLLYHGDEGRGRRRMPFLVTSWFSMIGRGARPADRRARATNVRKPYVKLRPNFKGHSFVTRYLQDAWPDVVGTCFGLVFVHVAGIRQAIVRSGFTQLLSS